jgi:hypothetical protein
MGSLSSGTFLVFIILCPGFLFFTTFYSFGRLNRADNQHGPIFDAAAFVAVSTIFHAVVGGAYFLIADNVLNTPIIGVLFAPPKNWNETQIESIISVLILYFVLISVISFLSGYATIRMIESGIINTDIFHGPYYGFVKGKEPPITIVSVLTNIAYTNRLVVYEGIMDEVSFLAYKRINYVAISSPRRFLLKIKDDTVEPTQSKYHTNIDEEGNLPAILIIPGDKIMNVVFRPYSVGPVYHVRQAP